MWTFCQLLLLAGVLSSSLFVGFGVDDEEDAEGVLLADLSASSLVARGVSATAGLAWDERPVRVHRLTLREASQLRHVDCDIFGLVITESKSVVAETSSSSGRVTDEDVVVLVAKAEATDAARQALGSAQLLVGRGKFVVKLKDRVRAKVGTPRWCVAAADVHVWWCSTVTGGMR